MAVLREAMFPERHQGGVDRWTIDESFVYRNGDQFVDLATIDRVERSSSKRFRRTKHRLRLVGGPDTYDIVCQVPANRDVDDFETSFRRFEGRLITQFADEASGGEVWDMRSPVELLTGLALVVAALFVMWLASSVDSVSDLAGAVPFILAGGALLVIIHFTGSGTKARATAREFVDGRILRRRVDARELETPWSQLDGE